jgi:hypothetical protein
MRNKYPCYDGPNDGGSIWTDGAPKPGDLFQDSRGHRYVFSEYFGTWIYVGVSDDPQPARFRGAARTSRA